MSLIPNLVNYSVHLSAVYIQFARKNQANAKPQKLNQKFAMAEQKGTRTTDVKSSYLSEREKEEIGVGTHGDKPSSHDKETHGTSDDISENTSVDEVKGPSVFARAKEEIEAVVGSILPKK